MQVTFIEKTVCVGNRKIELDYPIADAFQQDDKLIVLYKPDSKTEKFGQFQNLVGLNLEGNQIWAAELPTTQSGDAYYRIASRAPLVASSIFSYEAEIDLETGKIKQSHFFK